jgi:hypothetical protein
VDGVGDTDIKIKLLLGGEKTVNEALRQALELQAVSVAARPQNNSTTVWGNRSSPTRAEGKIVGMLALWSARSLRE